MRKLATMITLASSGCVAQPAAAAALPSTPWNILGVLLCIVIAVMLSASIAAVGVWIWVALRFRKQWVEEKERDNRFVAEVEAEIARGARSAGPRFKL